MKKLIIASLWLTLAVVPLAFGQQVIVPFSSQAGSPQGTTGQIQYKAGVGSFGGFTASGGATINTTTGVVTLGDPGPSTLGGIESIAAVTSQWVNSISTLGVPSLLQPNFTDLAGTASAAQMETNFLAALNAEITPTNGNFIVGNGTTFGGRAIAAGDLPLGTNSASGAVQCDGTSISCSGGVISTVAASYPTAGDILVAPASGPVSGLAPTSGGVVYGASSSSFAVSPALTTNAVLVGAGAANPLVGSAIWSISPTTGYLWGQLNLSGAPTNGEGLFIYSPDGKTDVMNLRSFNNGTLNSGINLLKFDATNGTNVSSNSAVGSGQYIAQISFNGNNGTTFSTGASINPITTQAWSGSAQGARIDFDTTANNATAQAVNMRLDQNGAVLIPATCSNPGTNGLCVSGPAQLAQMMDTVTTLTMSASTVATNALLGNVFIGTMVHADSPYTFSNPSSLAAGQKIEYILTESSTGGDTVNSWGTDFAFPYGTPVFNPVANAVNTVYCKAQGTGAGGLICATTPWVLHTNTNCASGASPAVCASAQSGAVAVPVGTNPTLVVDTSAVTANSRIFLTPDESATIGGVTCNTVITTQGPLVVTARTAGTSFTIEVDATVATNPVCVDYTLIN